MCSFEIWNQRYLARSSEDESYDNWLSLRQPWLEQRLGKALDVGCGLGQDSAYLASLGFDVTALDYSDVAIDAARRRNPSIARFLVADVRDLKTVVDGPFSVIVASLSLHYFDHPETVAIFDSIAKLLVADGLFVFRVNAIECGSQDISAVGWEPVCVDGLRKQFFDKPKIVYLLSGRLSLIAIGNRVISRRGRPKSVIEAWCVRRQPVAQ